MRAIVIVSPGESGTLEMQERPLPNVGASDVLVRVAAAGVNRADLMQRRGNYPAPPGAPVDIPGIEYAGIIERVGAAVTRRGIGDRVMGLIGGGAYAEYVVVHEDETVSVPSSVSLVDAAAIPEAFITAHDALFTQSRLAPEETVLIHAVGSGVGTAGVQLAKSLSARVIGTARSSAKLDRARSLGMDIGVEASSGSFADAVAAEIGVDAVNVVLELVGGDYITDDIKVLAPRGRLALVGLLAGRSANVDLGMVLRKRITIRGTVMRARSLAEKIAAARAFEDYAMPLLLDGILRPVVDRVFDLSEVGAAQTHIESNATFGKVVLRM